MGMWKMKARDAINCLHLPMVSMQKIHNQDVYHDYESSAWSGIEDLRTNSYLYGSAALCCHPSHTKLRDIH